MSNAFTLGQKLASLRGHYRKTQKEVAQETGIKQEMLSFYETDKKTPTIDKLQKLANAYFTTIEGIENYEPSNIYNNTFNDNSKGFFNIGKLIVSSIDEIIHERITEKGLEKGKEVKITFSFKVE